MKITVFGSGCARCAETAALIAEMAAASGKDIVVEKVSDFKAIMAAGVMSTPAVAIDGVVVSTGKVPGREEIAAWLTGAAASAAESSCGCCCCGGKC